MKVTSVAGKITMAALLWTVTSFAAAPAGAEAPLDTVPPDLASVYCLDEAGHVDWVPDGVEIRIRPVGFQLDFSESLAAPDGTLPTSVTSTLSYRLLSAGPDAGLDTESCDEPDVDEDEVPILQVLPVDEDSVALMIDFGPVPDYEQGQYRLLVCDGALRDRAGNALDGDLDGEPGGTSVFTFRVERRNRFVNGYFDNGIEGWIAAVGASQDWTFASNQDADWAESSGSGQLANLTGQPVVAVGQCLGIADWERFLFLSKIATLPGSDDVIINQSCEFFPKANCDGEILGQTAADLVAVDADESWVQLTSPVVPPSGAGSMRCVLAVTPEPDYPVVAIDELEMVPMPMLADDFEQGHMGRWSSVVPMPE